MIPDHASLPISEIERLLRPCPHGWDPKDCALCGGVK